MIATLFDKTIVVRRKEIVTGYKQSIYTADVVMGNVQPLSNELEGVPSTTAKPYMVYCDIDANVKRNDRLEVIYKNYDGEIVDKVILSVKTINRCDYGGTAVDHLEIEAEQLTIE